MKELIKEFHRLYAEFKRPEYLKIAGELGKVETTDFQELWEKEVNDGCLRDGIAPIYQKGVDKNKIINKPMGE